MEFSCRGFKSHSGQLSTATSKNPSEWIPYVSAHSATLMWLGTENFDENKRGDWRRHTAEMKCYNNVIGVAVQSYLWVWVELIAW